MLLRWFRMWMTSTAQVSLSARVCVCVCAGSGAGGLGQGIADDSSGKLSGPRDCSVVS